MYDVKTVSAILQDNADAVKAAATVAYRNCKNRDKFLASEYNVNTKFIKARLQEDLFNTCFSVEEYFSKLGEKFGVSALDLIKTAFRGKTVSDGLTAVDEVDYDAILNMQSVAEINDAVTKIYGTNWLGISIDCSMLTDDEIRRKIRLLIEEHNGLKTWKAVGSLFVNAYPGVGVLKVTLDDYFDLYEMIEDHDLQRSYTLGDYEYRMKYNKDYAYELFREILELRCRRCLEALGIKYDRFDKKDVFSTLVLKQPEIREYYVSCFGGRSYSGKSYGDEDVITEFLCGKMRKSFECSRTLLDGKSCHVVSKDGFYYTFRRPGTDPLAYYSLKVNNSDEFDKKYRAVIPDNIIYQDIDLESFDQAAYCRMKNLSVCFAQRLFNEMLYTTALYEMQMSREFFEKNALFSDCTDVDYKRYCENSIFYIENSCYVSEVLRTARANGFEMHIIFDHYLDLYVDNDEDAEYVRACALEAGVELEDAEIDDVLERCRSGYRLIKIEDTKKSTYSFADLTMPDTFDMNELLDDLYRFTLYGYFCDEVYEDIDYGSCLYVKADKMWRIANYAWKPIDYVYDIDKATGTVHRKLIDVDFGSAQSVRYYTCLDTGIAPEHEDLAGSAFSAQTDSCGLQYFVCGLTANVGFMCEMCVGVRMFGGKMKPMRWVEFADFNVNPHLYKQISSFDIADVKAAVLKLLAYK